MIFVVVIMKKLAMVYGGDPPEAVIVPVEHISGRR